jgi:hypothetical protein
VPADADVALDRPNPVGVCSRSYHCLTEPAARLFRLLALHTTEIGVTGTARITASDAAVLLAEPARASLVTEARPGATSAMTCSRGACPGSGIVNGAPRRRWLLRPRGRWPLPLPAGHNGEAYGGHRGDD